jgi:hypothetical protein
MEPLRRQVVRGVREGPRPSYPFATRPAAARGLLWSSMLRNAQVDGLQPRRDTGSATLADACPHPSWSRYGRELGGWGDIAVGELGVMLESGERYFDPESHVTVKATRAYLIDDPPALMSTCMGLLKGLKNSGTLTDTLAKSPLLPVRLVATE